VDVTGSITWTEAQLTALEARNQNLLVAAGAGSGKTAVLAERIIRLICDPVRPVDVDRLLVVTFTKAAAGEMRKRVAEALSRAFNRHPKSTQLERQLQLLPQAQITTLHSFCGEVLRRYYYLLDLDPGFRVADETEATILRQETLAELFEEHYRNIDNDPEFRFLVEGYGGERDDLKLQNLVLQLHLFARSNPWPQDWLRRAAGLEITGAGLDGEDQLAVALRNLVHARLQSLLSALRSALRLAAAPGGPGAYVRALQDEVTAAEELLACAAGSASGGWPDLRARILAFDFTSRLPSAGSAVDQSLKDLCTQFRKRAKKHLNDLREKFFSRAPAELLGELAALRPAMRRLSELAIAFEEAYIKAKLARNLVDFSDLEHYCLQVLLAAEATPEKPVPSAVAAEFREHFAEVLVDEYQDINAVQETILQLVSRPDDREPNRFMVGDVKQSIYRFRLTEPKLFLEKHREYPLEEGARARRIDLAHNFRSNEGIIHAVNFVFRRIMTPAVGELEYDSAAELICGRKSTLPTVLPEPVEVHLLERRPEAANPDEIDLDATQREARLIAGMIRRLVDEDRLAGIDRALSYRDIVVLMRAPTGKANTYLDEFRRLNIPAYAKTGTGYFQATEVETILSLLKVIDNPHQDIPLAAVLRSPLVGLRAADLADIRLSVPGGDFYRSVTAAAGGEGWVRERLADFLARLEHWRSRARRGSPADLIWSIYRETGYYDYAGAMPGGAGRQANLRALHDRARQYEATAWRGLFRFLRFIELLREGGQDLGPAPALAETEDVVRIMSIHQSKGLEFPVVILAGLGRQFHMPDLKQDVLFHKDLGLAPRYVDPEAGVNYPTVAWYALRERLRLEALSEEMRILYVAMTRARDKLILVGSVGGLEQSVFGWQHVSSGAVDQHLPVSALAEANSYLDWLVPALMPHPDAESLRREAGCAHPAAEARSGDPSNWELQLYKFEATAGRMVTAQPTADERSECLRRLEPVPTTGGMDEAVDKILSWEYPYPLSATLPAKVTVTEVKRRFDSNTDEAGIPAPYYRLVSGQPGFLQAPRSLSGAAYGAAMHLVLQHLELEGALSIDGIREQIAGMRHRELLTAAEAEAVDAQAIAAFFAGPLGGRLVRARWVRRELPFYLNVLAHEIYPELKDQSIIEQVVVQGVIDCLFAESGGLVLVDYKTDRVVPGREGELVVRYRGQINLYSRAVESILGAKVVERYLHLFATGDSLVI
jgi:ATP-dependent helicase/nuclease subunit A